MDIIVCIKQVPDTNDVKINPKTGTLIREGVPSIVNHDDKHAVEESLRLKEKFGGKVTAICMGPPQAAIALAEVYAMGVDEVILLSDKAFAGGDTWATSYAIGMGIRKIGKYDIIFCGRQAIDGDTAQVGPQLAEFLGIPQVTYVQKIEVFGSDLIVKRALEDGHMTIKVKMPVLLTAIKELNKPRYPNVSRVVTAFKEKVVKVWGLSDIAAPQSCVGLEGSPTQVKRTFAPEPRGIVQIISGNSVKEKVGSLIDHLKNKNVLR